MYFSGSVFLFDKEKVYFALFVDDGLIAAKMHRVLGEIIKVLSSYFSITLENIKIFAGSQIERDRTNKTTFIHQQAYTR